MVDLPSNAGYYDWHHKLVRDGVLSQLMEEYYDDDSVYTVRYNGSEYTYSIGTHPQLLYPHFNIDGIKYDNELGLIQEHDEDLIQRAAQQLSNDRTGDPELDSDIEDYLWNGDTYMVHQTNTDMTDLTAEFVLANSDFYTLVTQDQRLETEILEGILDSHLVGSSTIVSSDVFESSKFQLRDRFFSSVVDRVKNSHEFKHGIGGTYVTLVKSGGDYYLLTGERSSDVYIWPDKYTVFPAGVIQPADISTGNVIRDHLLDEYAQEIFGLESPKLSSRPVKSLNQLLDSDEAELTVTGAGLEYVYGNFQITGILIIEYEEYLEFMEEHAEQSFQHTGISLIKLDELDEIIETFAHPRNITPTSGFALANALTYLDEYTDIDHSVDVDVKQFIPERTPRFDVDDNGRVSFEKEGW